MKARRSSRGGDRPDWHASAGIVLLVLVSLVAQGGSLPHAHVGIEPGVYNADHDLTLLAASGTIAPFAPVLVFFVALATGPVVCPPPPSAGSLFAGDAESRAPPIA